MSVPVVFALHLDVAKSGGAVVAITRRATRYNASEGGVWFSWTNEDGTTEGVPLSMVVYFRAALSQNV
jgi:hypothetical protein